MYRGSSGIIRAIGSTSSTSWSLSTQSRGIDVYIAVADTSMTYVRVNKILYHRREIVVQRDVDGSRYGEVGVRVEVDGIVVASSSALTRLEVPVPREAAPDIKRPIAGSVHLQTSTA